MKNGNKTLYSKKTKVDPPIPIHMLEAKEKQVKNENGEEKKLMEKKPLTLQKCLDAYISEEELSEDERFIWTPDELKQGGFPQFADLEPDDDKWRELRNQFQDTRQMGFQSADDHAPDHIVLNMKIFAHQGGRTQVKLNREGRELLKSCSKGVTIPVYPKLSPDQTIRKIQPEKVKYRVSGVTCHAGGSATSGHYVAIKFDGDKTIICDDDVVLELKDYVSFHGLNSKNLQELVDEKGWSGYMFSLEREKQTKSR